MPPIVYSMVHCQTVPLICMRPWALFSSILFLALKKSSLLFGSRPSDHYFCSVCLFVFLSICLFVLCRVFLSRLRSDLDQTRTHITCLGVVVSPRIYGLCDPLGLGDPQKTCIFRGFGAAVNHHSVAASTNVNLYCTSLVYQIIRSCYSTSRLMHLL